ncbi:hypothetical protein KDA00_01925 [Candidatus Saccharibacteria bacterium]|nr:hypothetical protein [Candidatus Saccharibacteria bacterium]
MKKDDPLNLEVLPRGFDYPEPISPSGDLSVDTNSVGSRLPGVEIIDTFEAALDSMDIHGYAELAPRFGDILFDETRTNTFTYKATANDIGAKGFSDSSPNVRTMTEYEGLRGLFTFLKDAHDALISTTRPEDASLAVLTEGISQNLTFIGEKELKQSTAGIAEYWKKLLRENPSMQLCIFNEASSNQGEGKSDRFILEKIIENFSEDDAEEFDGRVKLDVNEITSDPEDTKVIILDDWSISGGQVRRSFGRIFPDLKEKGLLDRVEVHLLTASQKQIEKGILTSNVKRGGGEIVRLPVKAYYLAHSAPTARKPAGAIISGTHSAVNYDFEISIHDIVRRLRSIEAEDVDGPSTVMPPLTNIRRMYR